MMEIDENSNSMNIMTTSDEDIAGGAKKCCVNAKCQLGDQAGGSGGGRCISTHAMHSLYDLRQNNLLCDAVIRLEDGGVFPIHRAILSACSTYFRFALINVTCSEIHFGERVSSMLLCYRVDH